MKKSNFSKRTYYFVHILILALMLAYQPVLTAQKSQTGTLTVSGVVLDETGETLPGASIYLKDRPGVGTTTDINGKFSILASKNDIVIISFVGYDNYEYVVTKSVSNLEVHMSISAKMLEEAVVVGMGTQRKVSVVGAITSVNVDELQVPATSITNMLGGRVAGIISMQGSGEPGKNIAEFWIRGIGTFGANSGALVLVDGLEGSLSQIDPADIESFSVLKDASATAVYGVRGANGVVIVTTKRGSDQKLKITARTNVSLSYLNKIPEYLDAYDYALLANEARVVSGKDPRYTEREMEIIKYGLDPDIYPDVDWQKEILRRTSWQETAYLSAQGGGSIARYFISLGLSNETAAYKQEATSKYRKNVGYNTYNYRSNLDVNVTKTTTAYLGVDGYISVYNQPGMADTDWLWSSQAKLTPLTVPTRYSNGLYPAYGKDDLISPYILLNHTGMSTKKEYKNMVTLAINQDLSFLIPKLKFKIQGAFDNRSYTNGVRYMMLDLYNATGRNANGELIMLKKVNGSDMQYSQPPKYNYQWRKYHLEGNLNYENVFGSSHRVSGLLYYYMSSEERTDKLTSMLAIPQRYQGISSRLTYGYQDTYMIDFNFGYTGSENFKKGEQFGFFPAVAVGWIPTSYSFMKEKFSWLDYLKIRASYGQVGNDRISDDRFPYLTIINSNAAGGWGGRGLIETVVGADNLVWEKATKADVGIEAKFLQQRLSFVVDFFNDNRDGIFQKRTQLPSYVGAITMPYSNVGSMRSFGSDGNVTFSQNLGKDFSFTLRGNYTYTDNKIKHWEQPYQKYDYLSYENKPNEVLRGYMALGLFKDEQDVKNSPTQFGTVLPGDIKYKDVNGDGKITDDDMVPLAYSDKYPRLMYGFGGELRYKNFALGILFKGTGNSHFFMNKENYGYTPFYGETTGNVLTIVADQKNRWTPAWYSGNPETERQDVKFPRLSYGRNENNDRYSTFWLANSRYLRLQEVSLNYNLRNDFLKNAIGVSSIDLQLIGYNLAVWDKVKIWDPELANKNGKAYPIPMRFTFQVYVNF